MSLCTIFFSSRHVAQQYEKACEMRNALLFASLLRNHCNEGHCISAQYFYMRYIFLYSQYARYFSTQTMHNGGWGSPKLLLQPQWLLPLMNVAPLSFFVLAQGGRQGRDCAPPPSLRGSQPLFVSATDSNFERAVLEELSSYFGGRSVTLISRYSLVPLPDHREGKRKRREHLLIPVYCSLM